MLALPSAASTVGAALGSLLVVAAVLAGGCASVSGDRELAAERAQELVTKADRAGVGSNVTVGNIEALYGDSASAVCDAFDGGLGSAEALVVAGNPSGRRPKLITTDQAKYGRLVVEVYCPQHLDEYDGEIEDLRLATSD